MIKPTLAAIALVSTLTSTAYLYLPDNPETPAVSTSPPQPPVRQQQPLASPPQPPVRQQQPLETFYPLGILVLLILGLKATNLNR